MIFVTENIIKSACFHLQPTYKLKYNYMRSFKVVALFDQNDVKLLFIKVL